MRVVFVVVGAPVFGEHLRLQGEAPQVCCRILLSCKENQQLKRIVADQQLENLALREISRGNF